MFCKEWFIDHLYEDHLGCLLKRQIPKLQSILGSAFLNFYLLSRKFLNMWKFEKVPRSLDRSGTADHWSLLVNKDIYCTLQNTQHSKRPYKGISEVKSRTRKLTSVETSFARGHRPEGSRAELPDMSAAGKGASNKSTWNVWGS